MNKVYIVGAKRTAIGSFLGTISQVHPSELGGILIQSLIESTGIEPSNVDEVIIGNVLSAGQGQGLARQVSIKGGIPKEVPAYGINMVCGSGMKALMNGYVSIMAGLNHLIIAGGVESMSSAPFLLPGKLRQGNKLGDMIGTDHAVFDALTDAFEGYHMGITAENIAKKYSISREEQDLFSLESQKRAINAIDSGRFIDEIAPVIIKNKKENIFFDQDEYPNRRTDFEKISKLRPVFLKEGTVTAGNASGINDGGSMIMLASEEAILKYKLVPLVEIVGIGQGGVDPAFMGLGPIPAIEDVLKKCKMALGNLDLIELNEAFAAQSLGVIEELSLQHNMEKKQIIDITNVNGGAIALGHPVGASGNRIIVTLLHEMHKRNVDYGLASLCIGGGMGTAVILKRMS